jgi:putative dimethyl sulfoxide reductase chaperone
LESGKERFVPEDQASAVGKDETSSEGMEALLAARAFAYDLVKCAFLQEPSRKLLELLIEGKLVQAFPFADTSPAIGQAIGRIGKYLEQPDVLSGKSCERLRWDYTRMFIGPGKVPAPPWESIYRDVEHLHFSEETLEVREAYRKYQLAPKGLGHEPDDHIGLELDFLHRLCEMAKERAEQADETGLVGILVDQKAFLDEHLLRWVPEWTRDVVKSAESEFYKGMAQLLDAYLHLDRELLEELLETSPRKSSDSA